MTELSKPTGRPLAEPESDLRLPDRRLFLGWLMLGGLGTGMAAVLGQAYRQYRTRGAELNAALDDAVAMRVPIPARRGFISDRHGRELAVSELVDSCFADPAEFDKLSRKKPEQARELLTGLAGVLRQPSEELRATLTDRPERRFTWLRRFLAPPESQALTELVGRTRSAIVVGLRKESRRAYPEKTTACHVVGFVNQDGAQEGVEKSWDAWLTEEEGCAFARCDAAGRPLEILDGETCHPREGRSLQLTLDLTIQTVTEQVLADTAKKFSAPSATAIVMDCKTGELLSLANWPNYDPNRPGDFDGEARKNRAITDPYEPGSTFKVFAAAAALAAGKTRLGEPIHCEGGAFVYMKRRLHDHHSYGTLTFEEVVAKSSNIGMAKLGLRLGPEGLYDALCRFGFGRSTGIDLPGESRGLLYPTSRWSGTSVLSIAMGQECAVTPIQLVTGFAALANRGQLHRPHVVRQIQSIRPAGEDGGALVMPELDLTRPSPVGQSLSASAAESMVRDVMARVTREGGTGIKARLEEWEVFGKTGTAQVSRRGGGYESDMMTGSFLGGAPAHRPEVVVLMVLNRVGKRNSGGAYYGGQIAAPAVKEILGQVLAYRKVPHQPPPPPASANAEAGPRRRAGATDD